MLKKVKAKLHERKEKKRLEKLRKSSIAFQANTLDDEDDFVILQSLVRPDKSKSKKNDRSSSEIAPRPRAISGEYEIDETAFEFTLAGVAGGINEGVREHLCVPLCTFTRRLMEAILANATYKEGDNVGMPCPLFCTWYNMIGEDNELVEIPGVGGQCY